jgi:hypothetical protein
LPAVELSSISSRSRTPEAGERARHRRNVGISRMENGTVFRRREGVLERLPRLDGKIAFEPGRSSQCSLFARCAGVHVDFHAHRHFDNLRSFPSHSSLPSMVLARQ